MPNLPFWRRHSDQTDAEQLDELLDAGPFDAAANPEWQSVSDVLRSAAAATEPSELAGEAATGCLGPPPAGTRGHPTPSTPTHREVQDSDCKPVLESAPGTDRGRLSRWRGHAHRRSYGRVRVRPACSDPIVCPHHHRRTQAFRPQGEWFRRRRCPVEALPDAERQRQPLSAAVGIGLSKRVRNSQRNLDRIGDPIAVAVEVQAPRSRPDATRRSQALVDYRLCQSYTASHQVRQDARPQGARHLGEGRGGSQRRSPPTALHFRCRRTRAWPSQ